MTLRLEEQRAWKQQGELSRQLMKARVDLSAAAAKHVEQMEEVKTMMPVVVRGLERSTTGPGGIGCAARERITMVDADIL